MTNDDGLTYEHYIMSDRDMRTWQVMRDNVYLRNNSFIARLQPPPILTAPTSGEISLRNQQNSISFGFAAITVSFLAGPTVKRETISTQV